MKMKNQGLFQTMDSLKNIVFKLEHRAGNIYFEKKKSKV